VTAHESVQEHGPPPGGSDRGFGLTVGGILIALALVRGLLGSGFGTLAHLLLVVGGGLVATALVAAARLAPLNRLWTRLGLLLARIVNPIVLALIYVMAFLPIGLLMRAFGHDPLRRRRQPDGGTYWVERSPPGPAPDTMRNQF
jgi:hypothetical protein